MLLEWLLLIDFMSREISEVPNFMMTSIFAVDANLYRQEINFCLFSNITNISW